MLISPNRRLQGNRPEPVAGADGHLRDFKSFHGSYDRTLPSYIDNIDLGPIRDDVFAAHASNLPGGMFIEDKVRNGNIWLNIPVEQVNRYQFGSKDMSDDVFKGLIAKERARR